MSGDRTITGPGERLLTAQERLWLRHLLQMLSEQARTVRDSVAPGNGLKITDHVWAAQWAALKKEMDDYTADLLSGKGPVIVSRIFDHNE